MCEPSTVNLAMSKRIIILLSCSALVVAGLYHQAMLSIFHGWLNNEHYSHGLLILPVCAVLIYLKRKEIYRAERCVWHIIPLCCGLLLYLVGIVFFMPVVVAFSLLPVLAGLSLLFLGKGAKPFLFPIILLGTVIPVPAFELLTIPLQGISAVSVTEILQFAGMPASLDGFHVTLAEHTYWIAPACSGLHSIMALFSLTLIIIYLFQGSLLARITLLAFVVPVAVASNILRLIATMLIGEWYGMEAAIGFFHGVSSIIFFLFAMVMTFALAWILKVRISTEVHG